MENEIQGLNEGGNAIMDDGLDPRTAYGKWLLDDAVTRVRYQHEFSLAGLRTLVLINGGAIIALLAYAGNFPSNQPASQLVAAFSSYIVSLFSSTLAYVFAYLSQGLFMDVTYSNACNYLGLEAIDEKEKEKIERSEKIGKRCIRAAIALVVIGLLGFLSGSYFAMQAIV